MSVVKVVLFLALSIVVYAVVSSRGNLGEGFFEFNAKGRAQDALEEAREVSDAMHAYAAEYGDGVVRFGDPTQGEEPFLYLKERQLLRNYVDLQKGSPIESWRLSEDGETVQAVVRSEKICKYVNNANHLRPLTEPNPVCGTEEAKELTCCMEDPASVNGTEE